MTKRRAAKSITTGLSTQDPQLRAFLRGLASEGLVIKEKKGVRIRNMKKVVMKHACFAFNLGPITKTHVVAPRALKDKTPTAEHISRLVGEGIPAPSKGELPWASKPDIASYLDKPHMLTATVFANHLGVSRETINEWRKANKVIGVQGAKRGFRFPEWQVNDRGQPYPAIALILEELDGDHWAAWRFLEERISEVEDIGFQALAAGKERALMKALVGRSYGSFA
jgi:hypothetical protein